MREVAVTDGDKVEAMIKFGWSVPYYGIGDLVAYMNEVSQADIDALYDEYNQKYEIVHIEETITNESYMNPFLRKYLYQCNLRAYIASGQTEPDE